MLCIGKKSDEFFKRTEYHIIGSDLPRHLNELFDNLTFDQVAPVAQLVMNAFANKQFDKVIIIYNQFKNAAVQILQEEQFLPVQKPESTSSSSKVEYLFEPSKEYIVTELIPKSLKIQLYKALLDSHASEHGARMTAMHKATDNAGALIKDLKLTYNKARQASITNEILEIVGGAEALKG
jgi:F-type H+-transporting ATPase subunit gamma